MAVNMNVEQFINHVNQIATNRKRNAHSVTVGWEWEVPSSCDSQYSDTVYDYIQGNRHSYPSFDQTLDRFGFNRIVECGGMELQSPVYHNISTARQHAKYMMHVARRYQWLAPDREVSKTPAEICGIHVHVGDSNNASRRMEKIQSRYRSLLHRSRRHRDLFFKFSGRPPGGRLYAGQALIPSDTRVFWSGTKVNQPCERTVTLEFRHWDARSANLIPAIEYSHSMFRYLRTIVNDRSPLSLEDWAQWVANKKGYATLKQTSFFNSLKGA